MSEQGTQGSPLQSERGGTRIEDGVVSKIAGIAAQEVQGIQMGGGATRAAGGLLESLPGVSGESRGVSVEVGEVESAINLTLAVEYGNPVPRISEAVRKNVINRVENLTGLRVAEVNITVNDIVFPQQEEQREEG